MLADEDLLFRGPDAASGFSRPAPRLIPGIIHGGIAFALGLAALWYVQGLSPDSIVLAIPFNNSLLLPSSHSSVVAKGEYKKNFFS